jgi:hypothetical protein
MKNDHICYFLRSVFSLGKKRNLLYQTLEASLCKCTAPLIVMKQAIVATNYLAFKISTKGVDDLTVQVDKLCLPFFYSDLT